MGFQRSFVAKALAAIRAAIRRFPCVDPHVLFQVPFPAKPHIAFTAQIGLISRVSSYVHGQISLACEGPAAFSADMRGSDTMRDHVVLQAALNCEICITTIAFKRSFSGMISHMPGEQTLVQKAFLTYRTDKGPFL